MTLSADPSAARPAVAPAVVDLLKFIDTSPSPYHAAENVTERLLAAGFVHFDPGAPTTGASHGVAQLGGSVIAWAAPANAAASLPFRLFGAHTDSPNLRVKALPETGRAGWRQLGVEVYGGALVNSWLDRDLGLSGRVALRNSEVAAGYETRLVKVDEPILRVPQLAIHLDREVNDKGLLLNKQQHLVPVWALGESHEGEFSEFLAERLGVAPADVLSWDIMLHDLTPSVVGGRDAEFIFAPRLDNLLSTHAGLAAFEALVASGDQNSVAVLCLFDHEEVGSTTQTGAVSSYLAHLLEQSILSRGGSRSDYLAAMAGSQLLSADMAHAVHPNYPDRHEPNHHVQINGGPVIKINANQRYASDALSVAAFQLAAERAGVNTQRYIHRTDLACGSTIGPLSAAGLGVSTVDVGVAQLSMHSAREMAGTADIPTFVTCVTEFLRD